MSRAANVNWIAFLRTIDAGDVECLDRLELAAVEGPRNRDALFVARLCQAVRRELAADEAFRGAVIAKLDTEFDEPDGECYEGRIVPPPPPGV
jgi:hypothetical protein